MLARAKVKTDDDFEAACIEYDAADRALQGKVRERESKRLALSLAAGNVADLASDRTAKARELAGEELARAQRRPDKVLAELRDLDDELHNLRARHAAASERWAHAKSRRTTQIALALQPKQADLARRIGKTLEALSLLIAESDRLDAEFHSQAPNASSVFWQSVASELHWARLNDWRSAASAWAKRMHQLNLLGGSK